MAKECAAQQTCLDRSVAGDAQAGQPFPLALLQTWSRTQLAQHLNVKTGNSGKYGTYSRAKLIERLLALETAPSSRNEVMVNRKRAKQQKQVLQPPKIEKCDQKTQFVKRRSSRKGSNPRSLPSVNSAAKARLCDNAACRAQLVQGEVFCKRCSCCICKCFDDNKDPNLWIECKQGSCGSSCHLDCALKCKAAGVVKQGSRIQLDGSYCCQGCGWINPLIESWRKLLMVSKDARRVDVFSTHLSLAHRLLDGTSRYKELHEIVEGAVKELEEEIGPVRLASARGLVTRLSCGAKIQSVIEKAIKEAAQLPVEAVEQQKTFATKGKLERAYTTEIEEVNWDSMVVSWRGSEAVLGEEIVGHKIWCRAAGCGYPSDPVCCVGSEATKAPVTGLHPGVKYVLKIVPFTKSGEEVGEVEIRCTTAVKEQDWKHLLEITRRFESGQIGQEEFRIRDIGKHRSGSVRPIPVVETLVLDHTSGNATQTEEETSKANQSQHGTNTDSEAGTKLVSAQNSERPVSNALIQQHAEEQTSKPQNQTSGRGGSSLKRKQNAHQGDDRIVKQVLVEKLESSSNAAVMVQDSQSAGDEAPLDRSTSSSIRSDQLLRESSAKMNQPNDQLESSLKMHQSAAQQQQQVQEAFDEKSFENSIKMIRWLEKQGFLRPRFRLKLLSWLAIRATEEERRMVYVLVRTLMTDPAGLAQQLVDTFQEIVATKMFRIA